MVYYFLYIHTVLFFIYINTTCNVLKNQKYKKINSTFKLKKFIEDVELERNAESSSASANNAADANEIFKIILKEDWIPQQVKESLKTLNDFLNYLIKSLRTVKSKLFYEKIANHLNALYK
jgi:hypothetical protein